MYNYLLARSVAILVLNLSLASLLIADPQVDRGRDAANRGDFKTARKIWEVLADNGNSEAAYNLGRMYARGDGTSRDFKKARNYFERASGYGNHAAMVKLAKMYMFGDGVAKDTDRATELLTRAVAAGDTEAPAVLAQLSGHTSTDLAYGSTDQAGQNQKKSVQAAFANSNDSFRIEDRLKNADKPTEETTNVDGDSEQHPDDSGSTASNTNSVTDENTFNNNTEESPPSPSVDERENNQGNGSDSQFSGNQFGQPDPSSGIGATTNGFADAVQQLGRIAASGIK